MEGNRKRIGVIGGGASGMAAAIAAARAGCAVTLLERREKPGMKLLATGNGRCNLSNRDLQVQRDYRSRSAFRLPVFFEQFGVKDTVRFFESCGLLLTERNGGLYPRSMQAEAVREALLEELKRWDVDVVCGCRIENVRRDRLFYISSGGEELCFDRLILACGSAAGLSPKNAADGFALARGLGLEMVPLLPSLVALRCEEAFFPALAGVRCAAQVELHVQGAREEVWRERGEVQLTDYGMSGIPVFQCSRFAAAALQEGKRVSVFLDFLPEYAPEQWKALCNRQFRLCRGKRALTLASGMVAAKTARVLLKLCGLHAEDTVGEETKDRIFALFGLMRRFPVTVTGTNPISQAQVCAGGVSLNEVTDHLEAKKVPGLFLCGEMLDVDGRCGGYNLQWAWTSGIIAGRHAAGESGT